MKRDWTKDDFLFFFTPVALQVASSSEERSYIFSRFSSQLCYARCSGWSTELAFALQESWFLREVAALRSWLYSPSTSEMALCALAFDESA